MFRTLQGRQPNTKLPANSTDCHMHYFDSQRYAGSPDGPVPPEDASLDDYRQLQAWLGLGRVVFVQSNAHQKDNRSIEAALLAWGDQARGIVAVDPSISDAEIARLHALGVRGVRIMDIFGGAVGLDQMLALNARIAAFNWSLIAQFDGNQLVEKQSLFESIEGDYVIDHVGKFLKPVAVEGKEFAALLSLIDRGNCYVKVAGFYETSVRGAPHFEDIEALSRALFQHAPERMLWGSNWPHVMAKNAETYPDDVQLLDLVCDWAGSDANRQMLFVDNPARLYGFGE